METLIEKQKADLSHQSLKKITEFFAAIGLPVQADSSDEDPEFVEDQLSRIGPTRNIYEHNNGRVNQIYLDQVEDAGVELGQQLVSRLS